MQTSVEKGNPRVPAVSFPFFLLERERFLCALDSAYSSAFLTACKDQNKSVPIELALKDLHLNSVIFAIPHC